MASVSYIGLGSNIETPTSTRFDYLHSAVRQLAQLDAVTVEAASHVYETAPVGFETQENFYNAVLRISTTFTPRELLRICLDVVEKRGGRIRTTQDGPRTLDVDILTFGDEEINEDGLVIPHPRYRERAFVMVPLNEIAPEMTGDLDNYDFVDTVEGVVQLDLNFDDIIESYRERDV